MVVPRQGRRERSYLEGTGATEDAASGRAARPEDIATIPPSPAWSAAHGCGRRLEEQARQSQIDSLDNVRWAVLEASGQISFIPKQ